MIWYIIIGLMAVIVCLDIASLIKPRPSFKSVLKSIFNNHALMVFYFAPVGFSLLAVVGNIGCMNIESSSELTLVVLNGLAWTFNIMAYGILGLYFWDILYSWKMKKKSEFYAWIDKIDKEGAIRYTPEERAYFEAKDKEFKEKMRKKFPFLEKLAKLIDKQKVI